MRELRYSRHGVGIDVDVGKQMCIAPTVNGRGRATQLNPYSALHEIGDKFFVRIASGHHPFGIVCLIIQRHVAGIRMKYGNNLVGGLPIRNVLW